MDWLSSSRNRANSPFMMSKHVCCVPAAITLQPHPLTSVPMRYPNIWLTITRICGSSRSIRLFAFHSIPTTFSFTITPTDRNAGCWDLTHGEGYGHQTVRFPSTRLPGMGWRNTCGIRGRQVLLLSPSSDSRHIRS